MAQTKQLLIPLLLVVVTGCSDPCPDVHPWNSTFTCQSTYRFNPIQLWRE